MSKTVRRIALSVLCAILLACAVTVGVLFGTKNNPNGIADSGNNTAQGGANASGTAGSLGADNKTDYVIALSGTATDMATQWKTAMGYNGSVTVVLKNNWTATGGSFGTCTGNEVGFGSTGGLVIPSNKTVVLNMNGFNINRGLSGPTVNGSVITVSASSELIINGSGNITGGNTSTTDGGGGILCYGSLIMNGGNITGNSSPWAGGISFMTAGETFTLNSGSITNNTATTFSGGGVGIAGTFKMYGGTISGNSAVTGGGVHASGVFNMYNGEISNNTATNGGGVHSTGTNNNYFQQDGGVIKNNTASLGGGVYTNGGEIYLCSFVTGNTATTNGAAVYIENSGYVDTASGCYISGNIGGAAVYVADAQFNMDGGQIVNNPSCTHGIFSASASSTVILREADDGVNISGNAIGVYVSSSSSLFRIRGNIRISGNATANLYLGANVKIQTNAAIAPYGESCVGITCTTNNYVFTNGYCTSGGVSTGTAALRFFYPDDNTKIFVRCQANGTVSSNNANNVELKVQNGTSYTLSWSAVINGVTQSLNGGIYNCYYGDVLTSVTATGANTLSWVASQGFNGLISGCSDDIQAWPEDATITTLGAVGSYEFYLAGTATLGGSMTNANTGMRQVFIKFNPRPVTVTINNKSSGFGDSLQTLDGSITSGTLANGDTLDDLGITYTKAPGDCVGQYTITATASNPNYDVTFVDGTYEITSKDVWVTINDQYADYGSKFYALTKTENNTPWAAVGAITNDNGQDYDSEGYLVDSDGDRINDNGDKLYNGGWRYTDGTPTNFLASDISSSTRYPFTLKCSGTGFTDITDTSNTAYIVVGKYFISYTASPNYNVTFTSNGTNGAANTQGVFEIKGAAISVKSAAVYDSENLYDSKDYTGNAINIEIPSGAIELKGDITAATVKYVVFESDDTNIPSTDPKANDTSFWTTALTAPSETNAGTYKVYSLITATNHKDTVYIWTFKIGASTASFTLSVQHGGADVTADANGVYKVTYDDTKAVTAKITFTTSGVTTTNCPVVFYYKGTNSGNTYGAANDADFPDNSGTDDNNNPRNLGNSNGPKDAGTYRATVIIDPTATSGYELDSSCSQTISFTIEPKTVNLPTTSPTTMTYNGNSQTISYVYDAKAVKEITSTDTANFTGLSEVVNGNTVDYKDLTFDSTTTSGTNKTTKFTATNAGKYAVNFELASTRNYKWNISDTTKETQPYIVSYTIDQKTLTITLTPPTGISSWSWGVGTEGNITATALTGVVNNDAVTFNVSWYNKPTSGTPSSPSVDQSDVAWGDIEFDVSAFTSTGTYVLWVQLYDDSTGADVNGNYKFTGTDTNFNPAEENVFVQSITVGSGSVDVSGLKWGWSQDGSIPVEIDATTELIYTIVNGTVKGFTVTLLDGANGTTNSLPSYLEIDVTKNDGGYTLGYKDNVKSGANDYTANVMLTIASGNSDYKFESTGSHGYTYVDDTHAYVEYSWTIEALELDFADAEWVFSSNATGVNDTSATWTNYDENAIGGVPEYTGTGLTYVKLSDTYLTGLGLTPTGATPDVSISYALNTQILAETSTTTKAFITLSNSNYKLPTSPNPFYAELVWEISLKQINITGWTAGGRTISGNDGQGGNKAFSFDSPVVGNTDQDYTVMFEYVYEYTINGVTYSNRTEAQMIQDVYAVANVTTPVDGYATLKLKSPYDETYELNAGTGGSLTRYFSCGSSKTMVTVSLTGTHVSYADGGDFAISATYYPGNVTTLTQMDFIAQNPTDLEVTLKDAAGQVKVFTANNAGDADVLEFVKNAGTYTLEFKITSATLENAYALSVSSLTYIVARKEIVVPQIIKAITFNGSLITFTDHLDNQYTANSSMIDVTGDTECRNVKSSGAYSVTLKLNDDNYCWVLPASTASSTKGLAKITLADDTVETNVSIPATDPTRAVYSWNVAPMVVDTSKSWNNGKLTLPAGLQNLVNSGDVTVKYNYYNDAGELLGDSENGFEPQGGVSYRIEAVLEGTDADLGNIVFQSADGTTTSNTSDRVLYTAPKSGMAKFKDTLTTKYMGLPLWAWIVIGVAALILLIILICIIVAACKKKKKKEEEKAAKAEKEEAKAAAAAAAAAPMLAMSASMADEKAKLEAEKAKMEAELAKAKMEAEAEAARAKAQAEAEAAKAKAQAELDLQRAKTEAEIARMRAEAQQASQPAPAPVQQPVQQPQPQYQQQPQYMPQPQPQYIPMPMPQPQYMPQQQNNGGGSSSVEHMLMEMKAQQAISEAKNEAQFRIMSAENKAAQEVAEAKAQARNNGNQMPYPPMMGMGMGMNPMMGMGYAQPQQGNNSPVILTIGPNGEVKQLSTQPAAPVVQQPQVQPILINLGAQPQAQPAAQEQLPAPAQQSAPVAAEPAQPLSAQYPPGAVVTTTTTVDTTKTSSDVPEIRRRRNEENDLFDIDGFYDKFDGNI